MIKRQFQCPKTHNKSLHWIFTPLRSVKTSEFKRYIYKGEKMKISNKIILPTVLIALLSSGCAVKPIVLYDKSIQSSNLITIIDSRPAIEKKTRVSTLQATYNPGDDRFIPNLIEAVRIAISDKNDNNRTYEVSIRNFKILNYWGAFANKSNYAVLGPIWSNIHKNRNVVKCDIFGTVNNKEFSVSHAEAYDVLDTTSSIMVYDGPDANAATNRVVKECISLAVNKIVELDK